MLSKFICPITQFPDLEKIIQQISFKNFDILISALGRGGSNADIFKKNLSEDLALWKNFNSGHTSDVKVLSLELKIPDDIISAHDSKVIAGFINNLSSEVKDKISQPVTIFIEGTLGEEWKDSSSALIDGIELHNQNSFDTGFKFRTGGVRADAFPDSGKISYCIRKCLDRKVPLKFTAGLHHPFPVFESEMAVTMQGFINVFAAGIIAMRHDISVREMDEILNDANPSNFIFTEESFSWRDWKVEIDDIEFARKNLVLSFGSCSFDEPVDDLRSLHLL